MIDNKPVYLGLRLCEHDSNISLSIGDKVKYFKSERYKQLKHHGYNNSWGWRSVLKRWNIDLDSIDGVSIVIDNYEDNQAWAGKKSHLINFGDLKCPVYRLDHHWAHRLSMWPLRIKSTTDFVFDGYGDDFITHTIFKDDEIVQQMQRHESFSIGQALANIGVQFGLTGMEMDYAGKLMGLKSYGNVDLNFEKSLDKYGIEDIIKFSQFSSWLDYKQSDRDAVETQVDWLRMIHEKYESIFQEYFLKYANPKETITYSGGIAQNTVVNTKIKEVIPDIHIPPHSPDGGLSLGCIEFLRQLNGDSEFDNTGFPYWQSDEAPESIPSKQTIKDTAEKLAQGKIIGWYQGHGEIGPRALGNRSILMNPTVENGKDIINKKVKYRESFRPFGASILHEYTNEYFEWSDPSPYMLFIQEIKNKTDFKPITHVDNTCRLQTVENENPIYRELLEEFQKITGLPMLLNTSLNVAGKPIAGWKTDAYDVFYGSEIDGMVIGNDIMYK